MYILPYSVTFWQTKDEQSKTLGGKGVVIDPGTQISAELHTAYDRTLLHVGPPDVETPAWAWVDSSWLAGCEVPAISLSEIEAIRNA